MWALLCKGAEQCCRNCLQAFCQAVLQELALVKQLLQSISLEINSLEFTRIMF